MDSTGLRLMVLADERARADGRALRARPRPARRAARLRDHPHGRPAARSSTPGGGRRVTFDLELPRELDSAAAARHAVDQLAGKLPEEQLGDVRLLVSELVTNSLRHADLGPEDSIRSRQRRRRRRARRGRDPGKGFEFEGRADDPDTVEGWGLYLVATLADRWGVERNGVWFELDRAPGLDAAAWVRVMAFAPGRVNLLGEHTDYNGGLALPFAIDRGVTVRATTLPGAGAWPAPPISARPTSSACTAPARRGLARVRPRHGGRDAAGARAAPRDQGDVPRGGGLSSSAALGCALALALSRARRTRTAARWRGCARAWRTSGSAPRPACWTSTRRCSARRATPCGSTSPPTRSTRAARPRRLAAGGGPRRRPRDLAAPAATTTAAASARTRTTPSRAARATCDARTARAREAAAALRAGDVAALGPLLDASHASLRDDFEVSTDAVERVVDRLQAGGAAGARLIGGGFGGHVLALSSPARGCPPAALGSRRAAAPTSGTRRSGRRRAARSPPRPARGRGRRGCRAGR